MAASEALAQCGGDWPAALAEFRHTFAEALSVAVVSAAMESKDELIGWDAAGAVPDHPLVERVTLAVKNAVREAALMNGWGDIGRLR